MGPMGLVYQGRTFLKFTGMVCVDGQPAIGLLRLVFTFKVNLPARESNGAEGLLDIEAELFAGSKTVGRLFPLHAIELDNASEARPGRSLVMTLDLDHRRLDHLNSAFAEKPISLKADFFGFARGAAGIQQVKGSCSFEFSRESWAKTLARSGFAQTLLVDIVVPRGTDEKLAKGVEGLRRALGHRYGDDAHVAVSDCRIAMDEAALERKGVNFKKNPKDFTFEERVKLIRQALYGFCCGPHHSLAPDYREDEARLATGITALLLEYECRKRRR